MLLKITLCIWCNAMFTWFEVQKTHYFPHTVHYCCSSMLRISETCQFLQSLSFWEARCALIGQLSSALWLAEYLKRVTEMLRPLPCCDAVSRRDEIKTIKPTINEAFVAFSEDIQWCEKVLAPFLIFYFFACLPHFNVSDHRTNLNINQR